MVQLKQPSGSRLHFSFLRRHPRHEVPGLLTVFWRRIASDMARTPGCSKRAATYARGSRWDMHCSRMPLNKNSASDGAPCLQYLIHAILVFLGMLESSNVGLSVNLSTVSEDISCQMSSSRIDTDHTNGLVVDTWSILPPSETIRCTCRLSGCCLFGFGVDSDVQLASEDRCRSAKL